MNFTATIRDLSTPQPELFSLYEDEPGGGRPGSVTDPVPQVRVGRHTVEHRIEACTFVQILDAPVPQMENQLVEAFRPEQVMEVPKNSSSSRRSRRRRVPLVQQTAEQLVEVPTIVSFCSLHGLVEQNVDTPVPHSRGGRGGRGGLQGSRPGFILSLHLVLRMRFLQGVSHFSLIFSKSAKISRNSGSELGADFTPWTPAAHLAHVKPPGQGSTASSSVDRSSVAEEAFEGFFSHFSAKEKKCEGHRAGECAAGWARQLIHAERSSNGSCRSRRALELSRHGGRL